jgi:tRNA dimethylallyltransferase
VNTAGKPPPTVAIVGPTASGKARLGRVVAERLGLPILVCDSVKVYRGLDIGSAKPDVKARARVAHHLIDLVEPDVAFSSGDYARLALEQLAKGPGIFVGGTGFYLRATAWTHSLDDDAALGVPVDDARRAEFEDLWRQRERDEPGAIHRALYAVDADAANAIHPRNIVRCLRALWMCKVLHAPVSEAYLQDPQRSRFALMLVVLDPGPEAVRSAIKARVDAMLEAGWLAEVEKLLRDGYDARHKAMRSVGYRQLLDVAGGKADLDAATAAIKTATCQVARRQRAYFRHQLPADVIVRITDPAGFPWATATEFIRGGAA